ncbi:hypothetical protein HID58_096375, partial [Brassica napus]
ASLNQSRFHPIMENVFLCCEAFQLGQTSYFIVSSLIRFWDSRNVNKNGEFMGINLIFLDEKVSHLSLTHKSYKFCDPRLIPAARASQLCAELIVKFDRFEVARCTITHHPFVIPIKLLMKS